MSVSQGFALDEIVTIRDSTDAPIVTYAGTETLAGSVRAGRAMDPTVSGQGLTFTPTWRSAGAGTVNVNLTAAQTATLNPGQYLVQLGLSDKSANFFEGYLVVSYSSGLSVLPPTYNTYDDILSYAPWITKLQTEMQVAGFAIERGLARSWLDNVIIQHSNWMFSNPQIGQSGFMPQSMFPGQINQPPNLWLREQLNLNYLVRRQNIIEITSKKSLFFIGCSQLEAMSDNQRKLAAWFGREADQMALSLRAEITLNSAYNATASLSNDDIWPSVTVDCGRSSLR